MKIQILIILLIAIADLSSSNPSKCARIPDGTGSNKSPPDGRFRLRIINDPIRYIPGETYKISLEGVTRFSSPSPQKFVGFFLTIERNNDEKTAFSRYEEDDLGSFTILYPALSKISEKCPNVVVNTNSVPKSDVLIEWTAPTSGKGCITFKSTIIEHRDIWFMDDGALSKTLCEDEADSIDPDSIVAECTACDEAKYELTFEGLWSRNTHPKDFPDDGWRTKFSDVIGASHAIDNHFWRYGNHSSPGMKEMAEFGATGLLEEELKNKGESIRTIIKARGISYPNVNGKTFAVFRVDSEHHLISVVSKLYPSPDWFVGVSDLELCLANGQWAEQKEVNLYPYDAGTDSGASYTAPDQPTRPQESIRRIKPNNPNDPRSPFYDPENLEMKPLAKLYITRQRLYEKNCDRNENGDDNGNYGRGHTGDDDDDDDNGDSNNNYNNRRDEDQEEDKTDYCVTNPWGQWKECNNPCGEGIQERRRYYKDPPNAHKNKCSEDLVETKPCKGTRGCPTNTNNVRTDNNDDKDKDEDENGSQEEGGDEDGEEEEVDKKDKECQVTDWKEEECSCQSGQPKKTIGRKFKISRNQKRCMIKYPKLLLEKSEDCPATDCNDDEESTPKPVGLNCPLDEWTQYSQCSTQVGMGIQIRVRKPRQNIRNSDENLKRIVNMYEKLKRSKFIRRNDDDDDDDITTLNVTTAADPSHACFGVQFVESRVCGRRNKAFDDDPKNFCMQTPLMQKCKAPPEIRYFYSHQLKRCATFLYTGCEISKNNFEALANCTETCNKQEIYGDEEPDSIQVANLVQERIDCVMTPWEYSPCNTTCGEGYRWKYRKVVSHPQNGGKPCPRNVRKLEKCKTSDCELVTRVQQHQYFPPIRVITTTRNPTPYCEYSDWSAWSPCSKSCGQSAVQIRTRALLNIDNSAFCHDRLEQRKCNLMPCLSQNYNYRPHSSYNSY